MKKILIINEDPLTRNFLTEILHSRFEITTADNGKKAFAILKIETFDMIISDMKLPDTTGLDILKKIRADSPSTAILIITASGSIENAVESMRLGAINYLIKPFSADMIEAIIAKINKTHHPIQNIAFPPLREQILIAESPVMKQIIGVLPTIAQSHASVFIHGESGTGKEMIAQALHHHSSRAPGAFIKVNCAAIPETLIESEFFGHEKGAFTGAYTRRIGRFELAHQGTLLLDEITETPQALQAKLLRVIQEQEFERIGGSKPIKVDVRLISTSNRDVRKAIEQKILREDLYYRLEVIPIHLPPLRERKEDIIPLAEYLLHKHALKNLKEIAPLSQEVKKALIDYHWPGNIRELSNYIERAVILGDYRNTPKHIQKSE